MANCTPAMTEYLRGCTLAHLLNAQSPLPEKDALKIGSLLCVAPQYLHDQDVVHREPPLHQTEITAAVPTVPAATAPRIFGW